MKMHHKYRRKVIKLKFKKQIAKELNLITIKKIVKRKVMLKNKEL